MSKKLYKTKKTDLGDIIECIPELEKLAKARGDKRIKILAEAKNCLIDAISELAKNCIRGNINLDDCKFKQARR